MQISKRWSRLVLALAFIVGAPVATAVPVFTNSSFETGNATGWGEVNPFFAVLNLAGFTGYAAQDGVFAYWMGASDTGFTSHLTQTVGGFSIGNSYKVTFGMVAEGGALNGRPGSFGQVDLTNASLTNVAFSIVDPGSCSIFGGPQCLGGWQEMSFSFTATAASVGFDFSGDARPHNASWEFALDNFRIADTTPVPEPGSLALLGLGLAGLYASRRRNLT